MTIDTRSNILRTGYMSYRNFLYNADGVDSVNDFLKRP